MLKKEFFTNGFVKEYRDNRGKLKMRYESYGADGSEVECYDKEGRTRKVSVYDIFGNLKEEEVTRYRKDGSYTVRGMELFGLYFMKSETEYSAAGRVLETWETNVPNLGEFDRKRRPSCVQVIDEDDLRDLRCEGILDFAVTTEEDKLVHDELIEIELSDRQAYESELRRETAGLFMGEDKAYYKSSWHKTYR